MRIFWKADSTFDASNAEVSMKDRPFSAAISSARYSQASVMCFRRGGSLYPPRRHNRVVHHSLAKAFASSVGTARRCFKSLLFPTSMMTIF